MKSNHPSEEIETLIFEIRGLNVMLDSELATLYGTETKRLKEQVRRNSERFPDDFMFELTKEEKEELIEGNERLNKLKFSPVFPMVFTEHGVLMLSSVLNSDTAIAVNIQVMRVFTQMRLTISTNNEILLKLEKLSGTVSHHSRDIRRIFSQLRKMEEEEKNRRLLALIAKETKGQHKQIVGFKPDRDKPKK
ncbi:MAG: ORF6N domain-containing protein [Flavobacteriales bacterium]|nr:ORF6N domain-containing protein [Flavobacteriales bacterium]MBK6945207.1 ORF6N domain-containing protein [Flavobacteriales bacterium]MBK7239556.1 ORF6N domain-containing protein [Flavobacteriales bacterium]MBK9535237.1 ORF6N domain-containing protein [Flavobacteriales bacterium]MBP9137788.1 ORF6N domain-containing protein [Flavobacteriales bacterium]